MHSHPLWMLLPWAVFALGAGLQFWRLTRAFRSTLARQTASNSDAFRQRLERIWRRDQPPR